MSGGGGGGSSEELQQRILFVLSALQEANEALDKCDRLVLEKVRERAELPEAAIEGTQGALAEEEHLGREEVTTVGSVRMKAEVKGQPKPQTQPPTQRSAPPPPPPPPPLPPPHKPTHRPVRKKEAAKSRENAKERTKHEGRRAGAGAARGGEEEGKVERLLRRVELKSEAQWENVTNFVRNILQRELEEEKWRSRGREELNLRLAHQNSLLRNKLEQKREERCQLTTKLDTIQRRLRRHHAPRRKGGRSREGEGRYVEIVKKLSRLYEELEAIGEGLNNIPDSPPAQPQPLPPQASPPPLPLQLSSAVVQTERDVTEEETQVGSSLLAVQTPEERRSVGGEGPRVTEWYSNGRSEGVLGLLSDIRLRINHLIRLNSPGDEGEGGCEREERREEDAVGVGGRGLRGACGCVERGLGRRGEEDLLELFAEEYRRVEEEWGGCAECGGWRGGRGEEEEQLVVSWK